MRNHFVFFYCYIGFSLVLVAGAETISNEELSALLSIKSSIVDPLNSIKDWRKPGDLERSAHCNWTGVQCNKNGLVERLQLSNMNLSGNVSDQIQILKSLTVLDLSYNAFESSLPKSLATLTSLKSFDVSVNNFCGSFPSGLGMAKNLAYVNASSNDFAGPLPEDLGNATMLETLDFRGGYFEGTIPLSFKNLKNLKFLGLSGNDLSGKLPKELGELSSLETIILGYNKFRGEIPDEFGNLTNLRYLDLAVGNLSGQIPGSLGRLKKLTTVYLYQNNFTGNIPKELGDAASLLFLDLSDNRISGEIPEEFANLADLRLLNLMRNRLKGLIPEKLDELPNLEVLELWQNSLTGSLPMGLGKHSPLQWLDVSSNELSGVIPTGLCDSGNLTKLILFSNSFSGSIPVGLSTCTSLVRVRIQNNLISGTIPVGFGSLPLLQRLELANNNLTGSIPYDIALSASLSFIDVSFNLLESSLPPNIFSSPNLQTFLASHNNLQTKIPDQFQDCPSLSVLDLSDNTFFGDIPQSIASCEKLVTLNLKNNNLTGEIPKSFVKMRMLAIVNLSNNSLSGKIPENFGSSPALETVNLSFNKLRGPIPSNNLFMMINPNDLTGNPGLCGGILPPCSLSIVAAASSGDHLGKMHINHAIFGFIIGALVLSSLVITFFTARWAHRRWDLYDGFFPDCFLAKQPNGEWPWRLVAFQRVSFTAGDILTSIKESNIIGMGATGIVYKADVTKRPNQLVAAKKLWRSARTDVEEHSGEDILNEVNLLGRLRHRNIVRLLGYVHNGSDVVMVYEYMPNGNLGTALHSAAPVAKLLVDWVSRYNVALGVAQGLNYLHNECDPPVIHRDIKSNNILLDANLDARIADFGLARMMVHKNETVSMVAGSYGYMAPECGYTLKVDERIDVYSFGVVLLELVTGKLPLDPSFGESIDIVEWLRTKTRSPKGLDEVLDRSLVGDCDHVREEMLLALRVANLCTAKLPKDRPTMRDVVTMLREAKPRRKSLCQDGAQSVSKDVPVFSSNSPVLGLL